MATHHRRRPRDDDDDDDHVHGDFTRNYKRSKAMVDGVATTVEQPAAVPPFGRKRRFDMDGDYDDDDPLNQDRANVVADRFESMTVSKRRRLRNACYARLEDEFPDVWRQLTGGPATFRGGGDPHPLVVSEYLRLRFSVERGESADANCMTLLHLLERRQWDGGWWGIEK